MSKLSEKEVTIVFDLLSPDLWCNRLLDYNVALTVDVLHLYYLAKKLQELNYRILTADVFVKNGNYCGKNILITDTETIYTSTLIKNGCIPAICYCGESPLVIPNYYNQLEKIVGRYKHCFLFQGAISHLQSATTIKHIYFWTNVKRDINKDIPWDERKFLVMINSNKRSLIPKLFRKTSDLVPWAKSTFYYLMNWNAFHDFPGNIPDLYYSRLKLLLYFSKIGKIDLFGQGWDNNIIGVNRIEQRTIQKTFKGSFPRGNENKHQILKKYKFAICFENTIFPGYITEKLFDCLLCGTIPIYFGASDVEDYIPDDVYIDFRKFKHASDLDKYISEMKYCEAKKYLNAATQFIQSEQFGKYYSEEWVNTFVNSIQEVIN